MTRVSVSVKRRETNFNKVTDAYKKKAIRLIGQAGNIVRNTAVNSIQQGSKNGRVYQKYTPRRTHTASASGSLKYVLCMYIIGMYIMYIYIYMCVHTIYIC